MDRRSWLWRRRSTEKSPAETESSVSSPSERLSDEQDTAKSSPSSAQSPEIASKEAQDDNVKVKVLSERLSSAVLDIRAKDDLVKQHSKVAEEAVLGWEKAEKEIASLKTQLNAANVKNSTLEDRIVHLDGALKECVRQLRRAKEEHDQNVQDALAQQSRQWESKKTDLELRIVEFKAKLEAKSEFSVNTDSDASSRLTSLEKENSALKVQLLAKSEELELRTIEKELNRRAAETASKQQLESIKKIAKLEAECRRLQANARRPSFGVHLRHAPSSVYAESVTDCQSDCSDSWASALITELDQFKNDRSSTRSASLAAADIGMMDDFLEMEKLALMNSPSKSEAEDASGQLVKLEEKIKKLTTEKADREKALHEGQRELRNTRHRTMVAEEKSVELQRQLNLVKGEKHSIETEMEAIENRRNELEGKLEVAHAEITSLMDKGRILEEQLESEKALTLELAAKYQQMDELEAERKELHVKMEASQSEARKLSEKIISLGRKLEEEKAFSAQLAAKCHDMEVLEEKKKDIEHELEAAREEISSLQKKVISLELKIQEEKALSDNLATRSRDLEALDVQTNELRSQLQSANSEIAGLNMKVKMLEEAEERHKPLTAGLECQLKLAQAETMRLKDNVSSLEKKLESQKNLSSAYITALDASEAQKNKFTSRFELKEAEVEELRRKIRFLEEQVHKEKAQSSELGVQCQNLKEQFLIRALSQPMNPMANKELHIKKVTL
ncbi:hypothetical protein E2562_034780 [Oryza meyeriana var. granulata]|uniref:Filament-like plant protein n=1 Tax=Oryza meyeriana var. granulata TaxID=110450 RepID=A0A6G1CKP0_9ORYZ|nr:hypothetical protein E2562_034780 [Oryza meyeriana var. granulata]KAF0900727.1 hypothetical protein E2562_034780 [Oryza meyeriana var. granulata]KAF0900728.1 hypothetical protein E2562_034780 [Oryza meyeriana var. granulata]KAF0900729.1 hypothetical protein E2562_034780 [Oryza meyeriana var. granulata]KAF0900730.1 hypothetical protein E2562_034780 [Oryza meyeriana var. granulata]